MKTNCNVVKSKITIYKINAKVSEAVLIKFHTILIHLYRKQYSIKQEQMQWINISVCVYVMIQKKNACLIKYQTRLQPNIPIYRFLFTIHSFGHICLWLYVSVCVCGSISSSSSSITITKVCFAVCDVTREYSIFFFSFHVWNDMRNKNTYRCLHTVLGYV